MKPVIAWFVNNPVASNLLMWMLVVGGLLTIPNIHREEFPNFDIDAIHVQVDYLGASPEEVEQSVCIRIEEAVEGLEGIKKIKSVAAEGYCSVNLELESGADKVKALNKVKSKIDSIDSFPAETERPVVTEVTIVTNVLQIMVSGKADERSLKELGRKLRDDLVELPGVSQVKLRYVRPYEISIEVSEQALRRHGLTLNKIAESIRQSSLDLPGGTVKTEGGEVLVRTIEQAYSGADFEEIVVLSESDGTQLRLSDIATVVDGFEDTNLRARFDGQPAVMIEVKRIGNEDVLDVARQVKTFVADSRPLMPEGISLTVWQDESQDLVDRLGVLSSNGLGGLVLVLIALALFLRFRLAVWVALGLPIAMIGAVAMFPAFGISISTLSVMAFILVLGILVDDAIVVGERIYAHHEMGSDWKTAAINGTQEVSVPVIFGVFTTMAAFIPVITIEGDMSAFFSTIGFVSIIALVFSIVESQLILPAHLAYHGESGTSKNKFAIKWSELQSKVSAWLDRVALYYYRPSLAKALEWRLLTVAIAFAVVIVVIGMLASGRLIFQFFPEVEGNRIYASLTMPAGTAPEQTIKAVERLEYAAEQLRTELDEGRSEEQGSMVLHVMASIGTQLAKGSISDNKEGGSHFAEVGLELDMPPDYDGIPPKQIAARWRELTGTIPDAVELSFSSAAFDAGAAIDIQLRSQDFEGLKAATNDVRQALEAYPGVFDVHDTFRAGKQEVQLQLLPEARLLGLTSADLARQVRRAFYGEEVQRVQRGQEDIKVMVRFPDTDRRSMASLENMRIRTPDGTEVAFASVARATLSRGVSEINREDGRRVIRVMADLDRHVSTPEEVLASLQANVLKDLKKNYPDLDYRLAGEAGEAADAITSLLRSVVMALILVYALLAIPLHSYTQPLVIMSVIPFGAIGAMIGHVVMGIDLVFFSVLGIVALSGVVINSSLVLVDYINRMRSEGQSVLDAVSQAGVVRFRPIVLTSITTFVGLVPLINADSLSVHLFVPMAVSLSFGVIIATSITLFLVPCLYLLLEDLLKRLNRNKSIAVNVSAL